MSLEKIEEQLENFEMVKVRIRQEGFHYCFKNYSNFEEIEDERFHELRKQYLETAEMLEKYVDIKIDELSDKLFDED
jgi:hypothetical protein